MKAESQSLKRIFQGAMRYLAPLYQRPYVWRYAEDDPENDRLGPFWEDVKRTIDRLVERDQLLAAAAGDPDKLAPMTPHFFGAVVIDEPQTVEGGVVAHEVIDGQQRLTTVQLLIAAAARVCDTEGRTKHASRLRKLCVQDEDIGASGDKRFKLRPTRFDRKAFAEVMDVDAPALDGPDQVAAAYRFFDEQLAQWVNELPPDHEGEYFDALRDTLYEHLLFVVIELQQGDNPQGIFESLNAQGERLLAIDLVKNQVFRRARHAKLDLEQLDTEVWSAHFADVWWREDVKQGRYRRPRAELFLMHWLTERTQGEISATGLFVEFARLFSADKIDLSNVKGFVDRFVDDASIYRQFESLEAGSRERLFFARREILDIGVVYPVALRLWREWLGKSLDRDRLVTGLRALESWLVRRTAMRLTSQNYNRVMLEVLSAMSAASDPVTGMVDHLRSFKEDTPTGWWPSDEKFRAHLTDRPLYNSITQARIRMLLGAAEARLQTPKTEKVSMPSKLSIEHVIPQSWKDTWPLKNPDDEAALARREESIHRLGNLTLVTSSLNPALSNDPWAEKRGELAQHSALRLNAQLVHEHIDCFDEDAIDARGAALADLLVNEWPGPDASDWA